MKRILILSLSILFFVILFTVPAYAENDPYTDAYNLIPDEVQDTLKNADINSLSSLLELIKDQGIGAVFKVLFSDISLPFSKMLSVLTVCILGSLLNLFVDRNDIKKIADIVFTLSICVFIISPLKDILTGVIDCISSCGVFLFAFLPVFAAFMTISQQGTSAVMYTSSTYLFTQFFMFLANNIIMPVSVGYFAFNLSSVVSDNMFKDILSSVKKAIIWCLSLITTVFAAMTSVQSVITSAADTVAVRTGKFIFGTSIPVVGSYVSEVLNTVIGGITVMRSGLGIFAIVVIVFLFVPVLAELVAWKISVKLCSFIISGNEAGKAVSVIQSFDDVLTILLSVILCIFIGMILSFSAMLVLGGVK